ncbi:MAG TPA: hypothetical protein VM778_07915 [Gemmatimonadota bacterium]|nr:hypothetical protein [Gemmatimonadota bacterium]
MAADRPARLAILGLSLFVLHAALTAALDPIPPIHNGYSVPSYLLGNVAALLVAWAVFRGSTDGVAARADAIGRPATRALMALGVAAAVGLALALREIDPELYREFGREEGVFEPLTLLAYAGSAGLLWSAGGRWGGAERKPWRMAALAFVFLSLEEIDYFGIFGGMIGRIDGEYAGSLHDLIRLWALGLVGPVANALLAGVALAGVALLWRAGYLKPGWVVGLARRPEAAWAAAGAAFLAAAASEEARLFGWDAAYPALEEALEMGGGLSLAAWSVESAARLARDAAGGAPLRARGTPGGPAATP